MNNEIEAELYRKEHRKLLARIGITNLNKVYPEAPSWLFPLEAAQGISASDALAKFNEIEDLVRDVLSLYDWPAPVIDDGYIIDPQGYLIENEDESLEDAGPRWAPQLGQKIRNFGGVASNQIVDLREWGLKALQALAAVKEAIKAGNASASAMAAVTAISFVNLIETMLQLGDMIRGSRRQARAGRSRRKDGWFKHMSLDAPVFLPPDQPPAGHKSLAAAAREVAERTRENPKSIERRWRRKGYSSPRPFRKPKR